MSTSGSHHGNISIITKSVSLFRKVCDELKCGQGDREREREREKECEKMLRKIKFKTNCKRKMTTFNDKVSKRNKL